ncbi:MAG: uracil-DNA glycosylase family protein [Neisseriaceae bacterium]|nr:uracil-DNA glycosylase family protein [Neisseriaceae bacterium]MBP6862724.1 uracil-DNA glycosylase family protein [Neisseriaceae bacterium]
MSEHDPEKIIETHPLPPFLPKHAKVLMMGTFPPPAQRWSESFYYPNFTNDMWRIMGLIFFDNKDYFLDVANKSIKADDIAAFLNDIGFALSDTVYKAHRLKGNAADQFLDIVEERDIRQLLDQLPDCHTVLTTGEKAMSIACGQFGVRKMPKPGECVVVEHNGQPLTLYRMPSSSRAYPLKLEKKTALYRRALAPVFGLADATPEA